MTGRETDLGSIIQGVLELRERIIVHLDGRHCRPHKVLAPSTSRSQKPAMAEDSRRPTVAG